MREPETMSQHEQLPVLAGAGRAPGGSAPAWLPLTLPLGPGQATISDLTREGDELHLTLRYRSPGMALSPQHFVLSDAAERERLRAWADVRSVDVRAFLLA